MDVLTSFQDAFDKEFEPGGRFEGAGRCNVINLTPHPLRIFVTPFCHLGSPGTENEVGFEAPWESIPWKNADGKLWGHWVEIPSSGSLRLAEVDEDPGQIEAAAGFLSYMPECPSGIMARTVRRRLTAPADLPEPRQNGIYIVSLPLLMGLAAIGIQRPDLWAPDTGGGAVRDDKGQIVGVTRLVQLVTP